jgi:hypothetical protein
MHGGVPMGEYDQKAAIEFRDQLRSLVGGAGTPAVRELYLYWIAELDEQIAAKQADSRVVDSPDQQTQTTTGLCQKPFTRSGG